MFAIPMALVFEAANFVSWRLNLSDTDFNRIADLSAVALVAAVVYQFDANLFHGVYGVLQWSPPVLFALPLAQAYSGRRGIRLTALILSIRHAEAKRQITEHRSIDIRWPYLVVCVLAASTTPAHGQWFYPGFCVLAGWGLWAARARRYRPVLWFGAMFVTLGIAFAGQNAVITLRASVEPMMVDWFHDRFWSFQNPFRSYTAIGSVGKLKLSDRILLRVRPGRGNAAPRLLHEASYQILSNDTWLAGNTKFDDVIATRGGTRWSLRRPHNRTRSVKVSGYMRRGQGLLSVPLGTTHIDSLPVDKVQLNPLGALKVEGAPDLASYEAFYEPSEDFVAGPDIHDRQLPFTQDDYLGGLVDTLGLNGLPADQVVERIETHLSTYSYSLDLGQSKVSIRDFLLETRSGHCEFFASATVLLLRAAGVPARYAAGYSVQEYSELESAYVVRRRHAHTWALAWVDGGWVEVDTTPATWADIERQAVPWWMSGYDLLSWLRHQMSAARLDGDRDRRGVLLWLLPGLVAVLLWRVLRRRRLVSAELSRNRWRADSPGLDSEFYLIARQLRSAGLKQRDGETTTHWLSRNADDGSLPGSKELFDTILPLHYSHRFDPAGLSRLKRSSLRAAVVAWLRSYGKP
jgi:hypothetical protein